MVFFTFQQKLEFASGHLYTLEFGRNGVGWGVGARMEFCREGGSNSCHGRIDCCRGGALEWSFFGAGWCGEEERWGNKQREKEKEEESRLARW